MDGNEMRYSMNWERDPVPNEALEGPEYFVYFGSFDAHSWGRRSFQVAKRSYSRHPKIKYVALQPVQVQCDV